jgi:NAD(P)-dependent dehydrogenase (short-subunit alcohol dehydrogenase family)
MPYNVPVTGASSGFGRLSAEALALAGHTVYASMRDTGGRNASQVAAIAEFSKEHDCDLPRDRRCASRRAAGAWRRRRLRSVACNKTAAHGFRSVPRHGVAAAAAASIQRPRVVPADDGSVAPQPPRHSGRQETTAIREWARCNGYEVANRPNPSRNPRRLPRRPLDQRRLAMVDMGDNGDVAGSPPADSGSSDRASSKR